jgi:metal-sulfur cluster biosynthetic enzyme
VNSSLSSASESPDENRFGPKDISMIDQENLLTALRTVKDPELNVNVVDLGLVYSVQTRDDQVDVEMTLTSPACPVGPEILRNAVTALEKVEGISKANVKLVMSPPWSPDKMTDAARDELGFF